MIDVGLENVGNTHFDELTATVRSDEPLAGVVERRAIFAIV
jgi:hypothetical protein